MSMPRIPRALSSASSGVGANLTPPALPRPPVLTWALTMTGPPSSSAAARAASGVVTTVCLVTGTPYLPNSSFACHSNRSTAREVTDVCSGGVRRADVRPDPLDDLARRRTRGEDLRDAHRLEQ